MTYCLGIKVRSGLVAIADTRITTGIESSVSKKISVHENERSSLFIMTAGLRSIRDKAVTYFEELFEDEEFKKVDKVFKAVNLFGEQLRRVASEDKSYLVESGLIFDLNTIVGGQMSKDHEHMLFMIYPQGNWIEIQMGTPFTIIGNSGYGKPILNRALTYESSVRFALKTGFLSFDSTRVSATDVGYPIDIAIYNRDSFKMQQHRIEEKDTAHIGELWASKLKKSIDEIPENWMDVMF